MRKLLIGLAGLVVLMIVAALILPNFIDWNDYKGRITTAIEGATGLSLTINGDITLSILPSPRLAVSGIRLAGAGDSEFVQLEELKVRVGIGALLERRIDVASVTLVKPIISLSVAEGGVANWSIMPLASADSGGQSSAAPTSDTLASQLQVSLTSLIIEDGSIHYRDTVAGIDEHVENLDATVSAVSLEGPFKVKAKATLRNQSLDVTLSTGRVQNDRSISLEITAMMKEPQTKAQFYGTLSELTGAAQLDGKLSVNGSNARMLINKHTGFELPPYLSGDYMLEAAISASSNGITFVDTIAEVGESRALGSIDLQFGDPLQANVVVNFPNLNIDALLKENASDTPIRTTSSGAAAVGTGSNTGVESTDGHVVGTTTFELPTNLNAHLELRIDAVQFQSGIIREAILRATLIDGGIAIEQATALLPGASEVSLSGFVLPVEGRPKFDGELSVTSDNLRGIIKWLKISPRVLPTDRLRNFSFKSLLKATPDALEITDINVELDASKIRGGLVLALRERPAFGLRLDVDKLNLEPYLRRPASNGDQAVESADAEQALSSTVDSTPNEVSVLSSLGILASFDANIDAHVERLSVYDTVVEKLYVDTSIVDGKLTLRELSVGEISGVAARVSGELTELAVNPRANLSFEANGRDVQTLSRLAGLNFRLPQGVKRNAIVSGQVDGTLPNLAVKASAALLGGNVKLDGLVKLLTVDPAYDFSLVLDHPNLNDVLKFVVPDFRPATSHLGPFEINLETTGNAVSVNVKELKGNVGPFAVRGEGSVKFDSARPIIRADFATSEVLLDLIMPIGGLSSTGQSTTSKLVASSVKSKVGTQSGTLPVSQVFPAVDVELNGRMAALSKGDVSLDDLQFHLILKDDQLIVDRFTAKTFGGTVQGTVEIDGNRSDPRITSNLVAANIQIRDLTNRLAGFNRVEGLISTNVDFTAEGLSHDRILATLNGKGSVSGKIRVIATEEEKAAAMTGSLVGALLGSKVREVQPFTDVFSILVSSFGNHLSALSGDYTIRKGVVHTESVVLDGGTAQAITRGSANIPAWLIDTITAVYSGGGKKPLVTAILSGPLDAPKIKFGGNALKSRRLSPQTNSLKKLLPEILGRTQTGTQKQESSGQTQKKLKPEDLLKDLLKGFGG